MKKAADFAAFFSGIFDKQELLKKKLLKF